MTNKKIGVFKYLDCSTAHVLPADMSLLEVHDIIAYPNKYGAWVYVPIDKHMPDWTSEFKNIGFSDNFIAVIEMAYTHNCYWVKFDSVGVRHDDLEDCSTFWR